MTAAVEFASVFLVATNRLLREALAKILHNKTDLRVVGSCAFAPAAAEQVIAANPDVLVLDAFTSSPEQVDFLREVQRRLEPIKLVFIGMDMNEQIFLSSVRLGARGFVLKDASAAETVSAVRAVAAGEAICPPQMCACLFRYVARQGNQFPSYQAKTSFGLTNREQQLVQLIGRGLTNKEIANQLNLAEQTVRNHVHRMLRKVGANDRLAAVELCRLQGLPV